MKTQERTEGEQRRLSLRAAFEVMFSESERSEYTFEYFLEDYTSGRAEGTHEDCSALSSQEHLSISLAEAIEFLRLNQ